MREPERFDDGYRAFISYSHQDKDWGEWLHRALEAYRVPKNIVGKETAHGPIPRRLTPIFRDRDELATADDLSEEITNALRKSQFLVVICSPAAAQSRWVNEEIKTYKRLHGEGLVRAVIVGGAPFSGDPETECFPEALRFKFDAGGEMTAERSEPIAADLRPGGDGKKYALSKLVAGLTGAKLDELIQREHQRRNARMRIVAGGLGAVAAAFGVVAWNAVIARDEAREQRAAAVEARDDAEGLIEFMLTDLRKRLDAVGRLDVLDSVGERALAYYDARDLSAADPDALGRRARAQLLIGEMDNSRGDLDAALGAYEAAAATTTTGEQLRRDPDNEQRLFDHSQSVFWVGYIAWQRGDAETARGYFTQYYDQAKRLVEIDPDNDDWQAELEYSYSNLGTLEMDEGNAAQAELHFRNSLKVSTRLAEKHPDDMERLLAQGQSYSWLAEALYHQAEIDEAREARVAELAIYSGAQHEAANHANLTDSESIAHYSLADILLASGRIDLASMEASKAITLAENLLQREPENLDFAERAAVAHTIIGEVYLHQGALTKARQSLSMAISIGDRLTENEDTIVRWKGINSALPSLLLARVEERENNSSKALAAYTKLVELLASIVTTGASSSAITRIYCNALAGQARLSPQEYNANLKNIISMLSPKLKANSPKSLTVLSEALIRMDRMAAAISIASQLYAVGYRHPDFMALLTANPGLLPAAPGAAPPP